MTDLNNKSLAELTAIYNERADKPIKKFSCSREAAIAKIEALAPKKSAAPKTKKLGVGAYVKELLISGTEPTKVLEKVLEKFPEAKTTMKCVYWYKNALKNG